jgi:tRNA A22 N-methylase
MKKLNARLLAAAELVRGEIIADIGSDHAYLPAWLVKNNKIKKAYAIDISVKCVERIKANLEKFNISQEIIEPVLSDGLNGFKHLEISDSSDLSDLTDIIIAGMGGETIAGIISDIINSIDIIKIKNPADINFILQPNTKKEVLKEFLIENQFKILQEITVQDKKRFYTIISAEYTKE